MTWFSDKKEKADIKYFLGMLSNSDLKKRNQAARELLKIGEASADAVISLLDSSNSISSDMAARLLVSLNSKATPALRVALQKAPFSTQEKIIDILGELRDEEAPTLLYEVLKSENYKLQILSANALGKSKNTEAVPHLLIALSDADPDVRIAALTALGKFRNAKICTNIANLLSDVEINVRISAVRALGKIKDPSAISYLVESLYDSFWWYGREDGIQTLLEVISSFGKAALDELVKAVQSEDPSVRRYALELLRPLREPRIIDLLEMAFYDMNYDVAEKALLALLEFEEKILPILFEALNSPEQWIREKAVWGMGEIGSNQAEKKLQEMLNDEAEPVRKEAMVALSKLKN